MSPNASYGDLHSITMALEILCLDRCCIPLCDDWSLYPLPHQMQWLSLGTIYWCVILLLCIVDMDTQLVLVITPYGIHPYGILLWCVHIGCYLTTPCILMRPLSNDCMWWSTTSLLYITFLHMLQVEVTISNRRPVLSLGAASSCETHIILH